MFNSSTFGRSAHGIIVHTGTRNPTPWSHFVDGFRIRYNFTGWYGYWLCSVRQWHLVIRATRHESVYTPGESTRSCCRNIYRKISNISRTKSENLNVSRLGLKFVFARYIETTFKGRMKMQLEQHRQEMPQLHLSDRQFNCLLKCVLY